MLFYILLLILPFINARGVITDPYCINGIIDRNACCVSECNQCGGVACSVNPLGAKNCCSNTIIGLPRYCNETVAPCVIVPVNVPDPTCKNGIVNKNICCNPNCTTCGGPSCSTDRYGSNNCCTTTISTSNISCDNYSAPCVISFENIPSNPTTSPTTSPTTGKPTTTQTPIEPPTSGGSNVIMNYNVGLLGITMIILALI